MLYFYLISVILTVIVLAKPPKNSNSTTALNPLNNILSKFHQSDFKLNYERTELVRYDKNLIKVNFRTFKYNRTTPVLNASFIFTDDVGYDLEVIGQAYKFASNEYRVFPLRCQVNVCAAVGSKAMGFDKFSQMGNVVCPLVKGKKYYFYNWAPDELHFPPFIPTGQYMVESQYLYHSTEIFVLPIPAGDGVIGKVLHEFAFFLHDKELIKDITKQKSYSSQPYLRPFKQVSSK